MGGKRGKGGGVTCFEEPREWLGFGVGIVRAGKAGGRGDGVPFRSYLPPDVVS